MECNCDEDDANEMIDDKYCICCEMRGEASNAFDSLWSQVSSAEDEYNTRMNMYR